MNHIETVVISKLETRANANIGRIQLNKPSSLNALDLKMVKAILEQLQAWQHDNSIAAVFIDSCLEKAFCAGGDIVSMYTAMSKEAKNNPEDLPDFMAEFFATEYRLDYCIHAYPKPIIAWGSGIIMGGGLGVFAGSHLKIVSETARVAMPEISIGLFPDVGASYFLNKMPKGVGKFLGLTASSVNAKDCIDIGIANHLILNQEKLNFITQLQALEQIDMQSIRKTCEALQSNDSSNIPVPTIAPLFDTLAVLEEMQSLADIENYLRTLIQGKELQLNQITYLQKALDNYCYGSPITAKLVVEQLKRGNKLKLADCFRMELNMAYRCSINGEFQEGVRALLIDKDKSPKWHYKSHTDVPDSVIEKHFTFLCESEKQGLGNLEQQFGVHNDSRE
ncbi:enoyl-CoA hydratase/isomerase family protein [Glaciecola petra]|uniref:3-hydroxyisobutyryl-CoA hydrolase n=1 Tax=Glaciecola petra TaxID=3075602 RepID=A0ABU2ZP87_9ALTE|nr:enoyl-CoA hydratase/isomerase family protein [Aestuariibacter sp. P117]MDT0594435.1 enoyl-CoA hydratase/isomerase family protein [Aestuariibacter sp. P117]